MLTLVIGAAAVAAVVALVKLVRQQTMITMHSESKQMRAEIQRWIRGGTPVGDAKALMERSGFACTNMQNETFAADHDSGRGQVFHESLDFLYCDRKALMAPVVMQRWQVALVLERDSVTDVLVSIGIIAP